MRGADCGSEIKELRVDGGATQNDLLMQFQSDLLDTDVLRPKVTETTAPGAILAGLLFKLLIELKVDEVITKF